jgi:hypothetical protein
LVYRPAVEFFFRCPIISHSIQIVSPILFVSIYPTFYWLYFQFFLSNFVLSSPIQF